MNKEQLTDLIIIQGGATVHLNTDFTVDNNNFEDGTILVREGSSLIVDEGFTLSLPNSDGSKGPMAIESNSELDNKGTIEIGVDRYRRQCAR